MRVGTFIPVLVLAALLASGCGSARPGTPDSPATYGPSRAQRDTALARVAGFKHLGFQVVAARLKLGVDTALAWRQLDTLLAKPTGDIFWMYPAAGFYFNCRDLLSDYWRGRFRETWKRYTPYRGDTENHFLMYYGTLFLFAQEWPDLPGSAWFNGKSSRENYDEAREYLTYWLDDVAGAGLTEWDSPRYLYYYLTPLIVLRDFTQDSTMRRRFETMLEYQLACYAASYLNGSYCGAHSRDGDGAVIDPRKAEATSYGQFYLEDSLAFVLPDLAYAAMSDFQCPEIIRRIAHDRDTAFEHTELRRSRAQMRFSRQRFEIFRRYSFMTPDYCLGSIPGGNVQPIQQHTWDVTFASPKGNNTIFGLHPQYSAKELGTFFPEEPELMVEGVARAKASYTNENKWVGGSPFEGIAQWRSTLTAVYDIPAGHSFGHVDLFFPKTLDTLIRDSSGWIFCRMGEAFVGVRPLEPGAWIEEPIAMRLRITSLRTGYVVECGSARERSFESFAAMLRPAHPSVRDTGIFTLLYTSPLTGATLAARPDSAVKAIVDPYEGEVDRKGLDLLHQGRHLWSVLGSRIITLQCMGKKRVLDFTRF